MKQFIIGKRWFYQYFIVKPFLEMFAKIDQGRVVDLGCGQGQLAGEIKKHCQNLEVFGLDKDKQAIIKAKQNFGLVHFGLGRLENLPYPNQIFAGAILVEVLEHVAKPALVLSEVKRVLKKGGWLYLTTPLEGEEKNFYGWLRKKTGYDPHLSDYGHVQKFSCKSLLKLVDKAGFKVFKKTFTAHFVNQFFQLGLGWLKAKTPKKFCFFLQPLFLLASFLGGIESLIFQKNLGLDIQLICQKK